MLNYDLFFRFFCSCEIETSVTFLIQIDNIVQLLESPVFTELRMQLLEPQQHPYLLKTLYGILMLLPQSGAYAKLQNRLHCISTLTLMNIAAEKNQQQLNSNSNSKDIEHEPMQGLLDHFKSIQAKHKISRSGDL